MSAAPDADSAAAGSGAAASPWRWPPGGDKFRLLAGILLLLFGVYAVGFLAVTAIRVTRAPAAGDFFGLWSAARFVVDHPAAQIYDPAKLQAAQVALGMDPQTTYPFPYPPSFLLVLWPLGRLGYFSAYAAAIGATLALFLCATVGPRWHKPAVLAALVAPTTTITVAAGQAGFLQAALLVGGLRLAARRPAVAGVLFALATYKPQMGLLVPVALAAAGLWRAIVAAAAALAVLAVLTGIVFGAAVWPAWAADLAQYADQFAAQNSQIIHLMPTVWASLVRLGVAAPLADLAPLGAAAAAIGIVWWSFRRGPTRLAVAALLVAAPLATPHAFVYDLPALATAVIWVIAERREAGDAFGTGEVLVMMAAMTAPITLVAGGSAFPFAAVSLVLLLGMILRRCRRVRAPFGGPG